MLEIELLVRFSFVYLFAFLQMFAQKIPNHEVDSLLISGIQEILFQNYEKAETIFTDLKITFPENPLGNIYIAASKIAKSVDYEENIDDDYIDSLLSIAKSQTEKLLDKDDENLWYNYYDALIYGYRAYFYSITSNLVAAFADGVLSLHCLQKCLEINNNFNEALIAQGIYKYWKSAQTKSLNWLPFVKDEREEGIKLLENSLTQNSYNFYLAAYSLIWIYIDNNESAKAVALGQKMLNEYPKSRFFRWGLARAYQDISKEKAKEIYGEILNSVQQIKNRNFYNDIVLKHKIAMLDFDLKQYEEAYKLCCEILDFNIKSIQIKKRLQNRLIRVEELKSKLEEILIVKK